MRSYKTTLKQILGEKKFSELSEYTFKKVNEKFGDLEMNEALKIVQVNHQAILIIAIQIARNCTKKQLMKSLHWNDEKVYQYLIVENLEEFIDLYKKYINTIIEFVRRQ